MFYLFNLHQGKILTGVIIWLVFCCIACYEANQDINQINDQNSSDYRKKRLRQAPTIGILVAIIVLALALALPLSVNE